MLFKRCVMLDRECIMHYRGCIMLHKGCISIMVHRGCIMLLVFYGFLLFLMVFFSFWLFSFLMYVMFDTFEPSLIIFPLWRHPWQWPPMDLYCFLRLICLDSASNKNTFPRSTTRERQNMGFQKMKRHFFQKSALIPRIRKCSENQIWSCFCKFVSCFSIFLARPGFS